jgi:hypothetical protein
MRLETRILYSFPPGKGTEPHNGLGAPRARPAGAERGIRAPASDGERGSGGRSPPV